MSRLTKRLGDQVIIKDIGVTDCKKVCDSMDKYDNPCDMCIIDEVFRKLAYFEDLEEQGRLIITEVGVGQTVWDIAIYSKWDGVRYSYGKRIVETKPMNVYQALAFSAKLGDTVFLTKEGAEEKLKELKGEMNETE